VDAVSDDAAVLSDLARVRAVFQLHVVEMHIKDEVTPFVFISEDARRAIAALGAAAFPPAKNTIERNA